ncbi:DUF4396 domain-containing protein [Deefgea piscis]|uniref:DUF4396 domain-containing protein n=1 Tax=Deefgea piscis TaxID=2739061 RepID=UPI001C827684|nr:DUF4396 domain-containing protein [Deefgea piscis]QZA82426.1 DUF4396 domain-containing protein [Deefgea piscis]
MPHAPLPDWLSTLAICSILIGIACFIYILLDQRQRPKPMMSIMLWVWPINALWAGPLAIWAYRHIGNGSKPRISHSASTMKMPSPPSTPQGTSDEAKPAMMNSMPMQDMPNMPKMDMSNMDMSNMKMPAPTSTPNSMSSMPEMKMEMPPHMKMDMKMDMKMQMGAKKPFWQSITAGTLHCGAGCSLADLIGPWLFAASPFLLWGSPVFGEWALSYLLALAIGVTFQYGGLIGMVPETGAALWWRALKVDSLSLTSWQIGMYGWMGLAIFVLIGPMSPTEPIFWFMMQIAMACGFITAYPMNWFLVKAGIKTAM